MSWISRWGIKNMRRWGGWHSLEEREEYLLDNIDRLYEKIEELELKNKIINEELNKIEEKAIMAVRKFFMEKVIVQHTKDSVYYTELKKEKIDE